MTIRKLNKWAEEKGVLDCELMVPRPDVLGIHGRGFQNVEEKTIFIHELKDGEKAELYVFL